MSVKKSRTSILRKCTSDYNKIYDNLNLSIKKLQLKMLHRSHAWVNTVKKKISQMDDSDIEFIDGKLFCTQCIRSQDDRPVHDRLLLHHDHVSGKYICFLCPNHNKGVHDKRNFNWVKLIFPLRFYTQLKQRFNVETPKEVVEHIMDVCKAKYGDDSK